MKKLQISPDLALPTEAVTQTVVVYGGKGMGKTNFGSVFAEELYAAGQRFSVLDPMGVWWGLQHGRARGESGLEVLLLGGIHGDLPIEPTAGEVVADLVADESISVVVDISRRADGRAWSKAEKIRFVTAYMTRLYERQVERRRPLMQIIDEAARFAPQSMRPGETDVASCLGSIEMVCEEGRNLGIGLTLLTQRSARLNKNVAELADVMIAFRVVGPNSVGAVTDWFGEHVPKERHKALVEELRRLPVGTALVVSPGWLEVEGTVAVRERRTFDSSSTPKSGHTLQAPGRATKPDLDKYRERMAETVERAKVNDPREQKKIIAELRKEIDRLTRQAGKAAAEKGSAKVEAVEVSVIKPAELKRIEEAIKKLDSILRRAEELQQAQAVNLEKFDEARNQVASEAAQLRDVLSRAAAQRETTRPPQRPTSPQPPPPPPRPPRDPVPAGDGELTRPQQKMLDALASFEAIGLTEVQKAHVAVFSGQSSKSSGFRANLSTLSAGGYVERLGDGQLRLTDLGREQASPVEVPASLEGLHRAWLDKLSGPQQRMLSLLIDAYPGALDKDLLANRSDQSHLSSGYRANLSTLSSLGLLERRAGGLVAATELLFPAGLA